MTAARLREAASPLPGCALRDSFLSSLGRLISGRGADGKCRCVVTTELTRLRTPDPMPALFSVELDRMTHQESRLFVKASRTSPGECHAVVADTWLAEIAIANARDTLLNQDDALAWRHSNQIDASPITPLRELFNAEPERQPPKPATLFTDSRVNGD